MAERMTIEALRYAQAVDETGSFSAAGRAYGVTQPALSAGVAKLEDMLGEKLFTRTTRGVFATPFGLALLPLIDEALGAVDAVIAEAARWSAPPAQGIRMGVSPLVNPRLVADAHGAVCGLTSVPLPRQLILSEANMTELREGLTSQDLDIIIVPSVAPMPRFTHRVIDSEPIVLIESLPTIDQPVRLQELAGKQLILLPDTCGLTTFTRDLLTAGAVPVRPYPGEAGSYRVLEQWSALGLGAALLPVSKLTDAQTPRRAVVDEEGNIVEIFYEAIWNPNSALASDLGVLAERLTKPRSRPV